MVSFVLPPQVVYCAEALRGCDLLAVAMKLSKSPYPELAFAAASVLQNFTMRGTSLFVLMNCSGCLVRSGLRA